MDAADLIKLLADRLGHAAVLIAQSELEAYQSDLLNKYRVPALCVVKPANTEEVAATVRLAREAGVPVTPAGGRTGFAGGAVAREGTSQIVVSLERMRSIRTLSPVDDLIVCDAGVTLAEIRQAAEAADRYFPVSHGGEGTSQIGGMVATNAGGNNVLRYGMARAHILGLEVVLASGDIWDGLRALRKDNSGYDLKQVFVGSEGTLGIVTAAALRLQPRPRERAAALCAVPGPHAAVELYNTVRNSAGELLSAFELMPRSGLELHLARAATAREPLSGRHEWMVLLEAETSIPDLDLGGLLERMLGEALEQGLIEDAAVARSLAQRNALWALREGMAEAQASSRLVIKSDTSVPVSAVAEFVDRATKAIHALLPDAVPIPFGHIGDGNIHFNVGAPPGMSAETFASHEARLSDAVCDTAIQLGGSISAEHGIGQLKLDTLRKAKSKTELEMMQRLKNSFDPGNLMNPGKIVEAGDPVLKLEAQS